MENKINIAELLKDCLSGMELDCPLFEGLEFDGIVDNEYLPIRCRVKNPNGGYNVYNFTKYGCWFDTTFAKCVIFPKGKTTWEGFQRPFKDGDNKAISCFCAIMFSVVITGVIIDYTTKDNPTTLDVYQGKTTLEITYRDSIPVDSTVVYKEEFKK